MTTLSLKLPPEVAKIMPFIVAAKATGDRKQIAWAKNEYDIARERARQRERWEREREERERKYAEEKRERAVHDAYWQEYDRAFRKAWAEEDREWKYWGQLGFPYAQEEGFFEPLPAQSCTKGRRRLHSQLRAEGAASFKYSHSRYARHDWGRFDFGSTSQYRARNRPRHTNGLVKNGRKPRTFRDRQ